MSAYGRGRWVVFQRPKLIQNIYLSCPTNRQDLFLCPKGNKAMAMLETSWDLNVAFKPLFHNASYIKESLLQECLPFTWKTENSSWKVKWFAPFRSWGASENMGCGLRWSNFCTLCSLLSWFGYSLKHRRTGNFLPGGGGEGGAVNCLSKKVEKKRGPYDATT